MGMDAPSTFRTIAVWALRVILGLIFLTVGITELTGTGHTVEWFAAMGTVVPLLDWRVRYRGSCAAFCTELDARRSDPAHLFCGIGSLALP
jgi:uncharacterized membrane protein YphA (DoxX/SURF4 family)